MASIVKYVSERINSNGYSQVIFRINVNRDVRLRYHTNIYVPAKQWNDKKSNLIVPKVYSNSKDLAVKNSLHDECQTLVTDIVSMETKIIRICDVEKPDVITQEHLDTVLSLCKETASEKITAELINKKMEARTPTKMEQGETRTIFSFMDEYLEKKHLSYDYTKGMKVLNRILARYEGFQQRTENKKFRLNINKLSSDDIDDIRNYMRDEYQLSTEYPTIFKDLLAQYPVEIKVVHKSPKLVMRGENAIIKLMKKLKTFFVWLNENGYTNNMPFMGIKIGVEVVGTPYYLSLPERDHVADFDLSGRPELAIQRDIFIFQCCIGCRVGDLLRMTDSNLINGAIEYVANKTKKEKADTVRVPLNKRALALVDKYKAEDSHGKLFPFISAQKYNEAIKEIFTLSGIDRIVTVIDPKTRNEIKRPLNEIASSHLARRTFCANLYKKVKDPNLVGKLSGHAEGSKAFARYRDIDEEMKQSLVALIE